MLAPASTVYCTVFDTGYLERALALHASLLAASPAAGFAFCCLDEQSATLLSRLALQRSVVVPFAAFATPELERVRPARSRGELAWTCKPFALLHLARAAPQAPWLVYVDADMMFFGDSDAALPGAAVHYLLTPHRFHAAFERYARTAGDHNAGYFAIRNSEAGRNAALWWGERCLESCSVQVTDLTYADQKYLDRMLDLLPGGSASGNAGLNAAPWNIERYRVEQAGGRVLLDGAPLLLYHFQALRRLNRWLVDLYGGERRVARTVRALIYRPYLERLREARRTLREAFGPQAPAPEAALRAPRDWVHLAVGMARGRHNLVRFPLPS